MKIEVPDLSNRKVLLATPAYEGKVGLDYLNGLVGSLNALRVAGAEAEYAVFANSGSVPRVRNQAVARMMGQGFTDLVFIDADMGWLPQDLCRILAYDTDIVAGAYLARSQDSPRWIVVWPEEIKQHEASGLLTAKRAGTGFMRIRRTVFEKLAELHSELHFEAPFITNEEDKKWLFAFFDYHLQKGEDGRVGHLSEDYRFCDLAREAGFDIWVDPKCDLTHVGGYKWRGAFADHVKARAVEENTDG